MGVNEHQPHVFVLPEDDANRKIANGFRLGLDPALLRRIRVLPPAGGWLKVLDDFESNHAAEMARCTIRHMVLLIDFDGNADRLTYATGRIREHLRDRVFIIGALTNPEALKSDLGPFYEAIGAKMAKDCREETDSMWGHALLRHNSSEVGRLRQRVRPILILITTT